MTSRNTGIGGTDMTTRRNALLTGLASLALPALPAAANEGFPTKPIRVIQPYQSGSTTELFGRLLATEMGQVLGQPLVIEAKPGGTGTLGTGEVARSRPDGYTLLINASIQVMYPGMFKNLPFDPVNDFAPVGILGRAPIIIVVQQASRIADFASMIALARAEPGKLTFASGGMGSLPHLTGELINLHSNVQITHVPYNGTGRAMTDVVAGHVDILYASVASAAPLIESGSLRPLAVTSGARLASLPQVPTVAESGIGDFDVTSWYGMWAPKGAPAAIVGRLNGAMQEAARMPGVQERLRTNTAVASDLAGAELDRFIRVESDKWLDVMRRAGIQPQ